MRLVLLKNATAGPRDYSCLLAPLPHPLAGEVKRWARAHIPRRALYHDPEKPGKHGYEREPHVTVKYGLHASHPGWLEVFLQLVDPIPLRLGTVSLFRSDRYDVVKLSVESPVLHELNALVSRTLQHTDTHPTYIPHVTLAYVRPGLGRQWEGADPFGDREVILDRLVWSGKDGRSIRLPLGRGRSRLAYGALPIIPGVRA